MKLAGDCDDSDDDDHDDDHDDDDGDDDDDETADDTYVNLYWMLTPADGVPSTRSSSLCLELWYDDADADTIDADDDGCDAGDYKGQAPLTCFDRIENEKNLNLAVISRPSFSQ